MFRTVVHTMLIKSNSTVELTVKMYTCNMFSAVIIRAYFTHFAIMNMIFTMLHTLHAMRSSHEKAVSLSVCLSSSGQLYRHSRHMPGAQNFKGARNS